MTEKRKPELDPEELEREEAAALPDREEMSILVSPGGIVPPALVGSDGDVMPAPMPPEPLRPTAPTVG